MGRPRDAIRSSWLDRDPPSPMLRPASSATSSWAPSRRGATTSIRRRPTTPPTSSLRTATSPSTRGFSLSFGAQAIVHFGKHGNMEWLPGKALALSETECWPEAVFGRRAAPLPIHRQRPGRGHAGQASLASRHHRPSHPAAYPRGNLLALARSRTADATSISKRRRSMSRRAKLLRARILDLVRDTGLDLDAWPRGPRKR